MQALAEACASGQINAQIVAVIADRPNAAGLDKAKERGIKTRVVDRSQFADNPQFESALLTACAREKPDLMALTGFMYVLSDDFIRAFAGRMMNIHPSLLPKYPGLHPHQRALDAGETVHGCSVHFVTEELDGGPVIIQDAIDIRPDDTAETLAKRVLHREHLIYPYAVSLFCAGRLTMKKGACELDGKRITEPLSLPDDAAGE